MCKAFFKDLKRQLIQAPGSLAIFVTLTKEANQTKHEETETNNSKTEKETRLGALNFSLRSDVCLSSNYALMEYTMCSFEPLCQNEDVS